MTLHRFTHSIASRLALGFGCLLALIVAVPAAASHLGAPRWQLPYAAAR